MNKIFLRKVNFLNGNNFSYGGKLPTRMCYLNDTFINTTNRKFTAYSSMEALMQASKGALVFSDMLRAPQASLRALREKKGVALPGNSGHNFGVSVDVDIEATIKNFIKNYWFHPQDSKNHYQALCSMMYSYGWSAFQGVKLGKETYERGREDWHFNFIGDFAYSVDSNSKIKSSERVKRWINANYPFIAQELSPIEIQTALKELKFYQGDIDGHLGPMTEMAIRSFKKAWLPETIFPKIFNLGKLDPTTSKILQIVNTQFLDENNQPI